jgi:hypothetical protein
MAIYHIHETRHGFAGGACFGPAVGGKGIVFGLSEQTGNIWLAEPAATEQ